MQKILRRIIKKLKKINQKLEKHEIIERINIKEIETEILNETKAIEEIETKLEKLKTVIMKKGFGTKLMSKKHWKD